METTVIDIEQKSINTAKGLIMDMVRHANSGHTGGPFSSLNFAYTLYKDFLKFDPDDPEWIDRDRFVLSCGHESALIYTLLTYMGWLTTEDLKQFRQLHSRTPGHPERGVTPGVDATTGPLGQGVGNAVGMAIAETVLQNTFGKDLINHYTWFLHSDGDIQEPVAQGAIAMAGHWGLGKLIGYYDANEIQISGSVSRSDSTNYPMLYRANHWHVQEVDGHDLDEIRDAIRIAQMEIEKPSIIIGHAKIATGCATMEGSADTHGAPLPAEEISATKEKLGLDPEHFFQLPIDVVEDFQTGFDYARQEAQTWKKTLQHRLENKKFKTKWDISIGGKLPELQWPHYEAGQTLATRKVWGRVIESMAEHHPTLAGGSADLEPSNVTGGFADMVGDFSTENTRGRNFAFGVREFPMGAALNGMMQHGGMKVFGSTFFVFSDYERPAIRLRALQNLPVVSEYTHDSIYVGEDGPTHQPIEHLMSLRTMPGLNVYRPADANEASFVSKLAFSDSSSPSLVLLTRQGVPVIDRTKFAPLDLVSKGGYILKDGGENPDIVIFATGSEVHIALDICEILTNKNIKVVNLVCWEIFENQSEEYKNNVIGPDTCLKVSIEAGVTFGWEKFTGNKGLNFGIDRFGESAPGSDVAEYFGLTADKIAAEISKII